MTQSSSQTRVVAAFDFDKTLTFKDTFLPFLTAVVGRAKVSLALLKVSPWALGYLLHLVSRQGLKEKMLQFCLKGRLPNSLQKAVKQFIAANGSFINPQALERLRWHQGEGHTTALVTAAIETYTIPWGEYLGFDHIVATRLQLDAQGAVTGKIDGLNCWGDEKVRRLQAELSPLQNYILYAYGDSAGDQSLLKEAQYPFYRTFQ